MSNLGSPEDGLVEQPALEWLQEVGWEYAYGPALPDGERESEREVVLRETLGAAVARLNLELPPEAIERAIELALTTSSPHQILDHQAFHDLLLGGVPVSWIDSAEGERSGRARLVDWDDPGANTFTAVNQFTIIDGTNNRRPDVLLFVNGLPLAQLELKAPSIEDDGPSMAVNQVQHYAHTIPALYRYVEVIGVSDLFRARVGTITTPAEHFAEWKSMDPAADKGRTPLEVLIRGVYTPAGLLDLIRNFVLFETDGAKTWKVMAKYHQVDAVNRAVAATAEAMDDGSGRAGVVWHTQGSGKSYSMVFYATKLRRDRRFANPTIVCVTDTNDLDNQLSQTFARQAHLAPVVKQAESIKDGPASLHRLLDVPADGIVFTTIQKFATEQGAEMPVLSERRNVVVIADEAHRSQYSTLAQNLLDALPNATRIGFTGTPIESADRSTRVTFGDYVSVYRMAQAQEDGATVPIYYESRQVPVNVDEALLERVQAVVDAESDEAQTELSSEFARMDAVIGAPERIERVVDDLVEHFTERCKALPGKAMVVAYSRRAAAEYALRLRERLGEEAVEAIFGAQATDPRPVSDFRKNKQQLKECEARFKDPGSPLRVVVVKNMWLTGFDAPVLHTLYIDKPMRDHGLLQAIARVNRVFEGKPGGLVVDYIGIGDDLRSSLTAYAKGDVDDVVVELEVAQRKLRESWEVLCDQLHDVTFRAADDATPGQRATLFATALPEAAALMEHDEERARGFLDQQAMFAKWFKLVSPNDPAGELRYYHAFFTQLAALVRQITDPDPPPPSAEARRVVEQFFSEGLVGGEIIDVFAMAGEERPELSVLTDEFLDGIQSKVSQPELQVALLRKLLRGEIRARLGANRTMNKRFSDALAELMQRYRERQISAADVVKAMVELARDLREQRLRHEQLGLTPEETAFYDVLAAKGEGWVDDPRLKDIAHEIVEQVRQDLAVDWAERGNLEALVRSRIKRLLRKHKVVLVASGGGGGELEEMADRVFQQAKALYQRWPEIEGVGL